MKEINSLLAISPIDGRYRNITENISEYFSEYAFIKYRVFVELDWLNYLLHMKEIYNENKDYSSIFFSKILFIKSVIIFPYAVLFISSEVQAKCTK